MEELASRWKNLSLSDKEGKKLALAQNKNRVDFVLATKFLTKRNVSIDAVAKTFRPLWRTRSDFCIRDAGNNHLLFTFELESDLEKVLLGEPWSFDRHLVVLQKYDGTSPMEHVDFSKSSFWIQLHNLPLTCLNPDIAMEIGDSLGDVNKSVNVSNMIGGNFMRIRVLIDITRPLCRGRIISLSNNDDRFISFKYERLLNICYWCGLVSHYEKECSLWLSSKRSLNADDQQFGPWIRATQINPTRKSVMEVKGFDKPSIQHHSRVTSKTRASSSSVQAGMSPSSVQACDIALMPVSGSAIGTTAGDVSRPVLEMVPVGVEGQSEPVCYDEDRLQQIIATTQEVDATLDSNNVPTVAKVFNEAYVSSNSLPNTAYATGNKENLPGSWNLDLSQTVLSTLSSTESHISHLSTNSPPRIGAVIDQGIHKLNLDMAIKDEDQHTSIARRGIRTTGIKLERGNKNRVQPRRWTRFHSRVGVVNLQTNSFSRSGTKCNFSSTFKAMVVDTEHEKKPKFQKDSDEHDDFLTSQLGSAEAVEQPHRGQ